MLAGWKILAFLLLLLSFKTYLSFTLPLFEEAL